MRIKNANRVKPPRGLVLCLAAFLLLATFSVSVVAAVHQSRLSENQDPEVNSGCLQLRNAFLVPDSKQWRLNLEFTVSKSTPITGKDFVVEWQSPYGEVMTLTNKPSIRNGPLEIVYLLDVDSTVLYLREALRTEEQVANERRFWRNLADQVTSKLDLRGVETYDRAAVYVAQATNIYTVTQAICSRAECQLFREGVVNTLLQGVESTYATQLISSESDWGMVAKLLQQDNWKATVILRWRDSPLDATSCAIPDKRKGMTFIVVLGRSANPPSWWSKIDELRKNHDFQIAYVPAPPLYQYELGASDLGEMLREMEKRFQAQPDELVIDARLPFVLDQASAKDSRLSVHQGTNCRLSDIRFPEVGQSEGRQLSGPGFVFLLPTALASLWFVIMLLLLFGAWAYQRPEVIAKLKSLLAKPTEKRG